MHKELMSSMGMPANCEIFSELVTTVLLMANCRAPSVHSHEARMLGADYKQAAI